MSKNRFLCIAIGLLALAPEARAAQDDLRAVSLGRYATPVRVRSDAGVQIP